MKKLQKLLENNNLKELKTTLLEMNEFDIAEFLQTLEEENLIKIFRLLPKEKATDVFVNLEDNIQKRLINSLTKKEATQIIEDMFTDDAADLFEEMPAMMVQSLLSNVDKETRNNINRLLKYPENSAGSLMAVEYIHLKKGNTIQESIEKIRSQQDQYASFDTCFITDKERKLLGTISIKDLILNDPNTQVDKIMKESKHKVLTLTDQEEVAKLFQDYNYQTLPVVDLENRLVGIITIDDIVDIIEEEATEDIEKMAAITPTEKPYNQITIKEVYKSRIPWLLLLMISATFTGKIIQSFEAELQAYTILTAFIPMIMDTGGNAGSQSSVSIIRALSLNDIEFKDILKVIWKELKVSILCGLTLSICNFLKLLIIDRIKPLVALTITITLIFTIIIAKIIGATLPMIAQKLKLDPAVMASPFITTIVDACGLLIYFYTAKLILGI